LAHDQIHLDIVKDLQVLIRKPSVSALNTGLEECAQLISNMMNRIGIKTELLVLSAMNKTENSYIQSIPPLVFGEINSKSNPDKKTILFYNHYDVQPVEPISLWNHDPFGGIIKNGKIHGRGSADDKGELITRIKAVEYFIKRFSDVPCNIKFLIEGEEEIGSPHLPNYLQKYRKKFVCDAVIWEFGYIDSKKRPIINLGMKGMLFVELTVKGPSVDLHSSLAPIIENPIWKLTKIVNELYDQETNRILIKDWYKNITSLSRDEKEFFNKQPLFDEIEFKKQYGLSKLLKSGVNIRTSLSLEPTCNLSNIMTNYVKKDPKTIVPSLATVQIDFRLVPNMNPDEQFRKLLNHLHLKKYGNLKVKYLHGLYPTRTSFKHPFVKLVIKSAESVYQRTSIVNASSAGSGPMHLITSDSQIPCITAGCTSIFSNIHSINEFADIRLLHKGTQLIITIINNYSKSN
jgi:acetylornithine deacetylase/succinyl-diaminopimelate desuccinylase-like protein